MRTNIALATLSSLILVAQTYFLATLLDKLIMQHVDRAELVPYFYCINHYFCVACGHFMATRKKLALKQVDYYEITCVKRF